MGKGFFLFVATPTEVIVHGPARHICIAHAKFTSFSFDYLPSPNVELTPPGTYNPNPLGQTPVAEPEAMDKNVKQDQKGGNSWIGD